MAVYAVANPSPSPGIDWHKNKPSPWLSKVLSGRAAGRTTGGVELLGQDDVRRLLVAFPDEHGGDTVVL